MAVNHVGTFVGDGCGPFLVSQCLEQPGGYHDARMQTRRGKSIWLVVIENDQVVTSVWVTTTQPLDGDEGGYSPDEQDYRRDCSRKC